MNSTATQQTLRRGCGPSPSNEPTPAGGGGEYYEDVPSNKIPQVGMNGALVEYCEDIPSDRYCNFRRRQAEGVFRSGSGGIISTKWYLVLLSVVIYAVGMLRGIKSQ